MAGLELNTKRTLLTYCKLEQKNLQQFHVIKLYVDSVWMDSYMYVLYDPWSESRWLSSPAFLWWVHFMTVEHTSVATQVNLLRDNSAELTK